jgi:hypothetical protein
MSQAVADQLFLAYMGRAADTQWRNNTATLTDAMGNNPTKALKDSFYTTAVSEGVYATADSPSTLVNKFFLTTFGFAARTDEQTFWGNLLSNGVYSAGELVWQMFSSYANNTTVLPTTYVVPMQSKLVALAAFSNALTDSTINAAYSQMNSAAAASGRTYLSAVTSQATAATAITGVAATVAAVSTTSSGSAFTLTTGIDNPTTTTASTITGTVNATVAASTFNTGDTISGANTVTITYTNAGAENVAANLSNVTKFSTTMLAAATVNAALFTNVSTIQSGGGGLGFALTVANGLLASTYGVSGETSAGGITLASTRTVVTGTADVINFAVTGSGTATGAVVLSNGVTGVETATVTTSGTNVFSISGAGFTTAVTDGTTLNITGSGNNTITASAMTNVVTYDMSTATGTNTLNLVGALTTSDVVRGGTGTDTLRVAQVGTAAALTVTGVETLRMSAANQTGTLNFSTAPTFTALRVDGDTAEAGTNTLTGIGATATALTYVGDATVANAGTAQQFNNLTITGSYTGSSDTLAVAVNNGGVSQTAAGGYTLRTLNVAGVETMTLAVSDIAAGATATFVGITDTTLASLAVTSAGNVALGTITTAGGAGTTGTLATLNLSGITGTGTSSATLADGVVAGNLTITATSGTGNTTIAVGAETTTDNIIYTGGAGVDTFTGTTFTGTVVISGLGGADIIAGGTGADTITGGEGGDTITGGGGADAIILTETVAAIDTVVFSVIATNGADTITGFSAANDLINLDLLGGGNAAGETAIAAGATTTDLTTAFIGVFANGANGTGAVAITSYTDLTTAAAGSVVAFLAAGLTEAAGESYVAVINDLAGGRAFVYNIIVNTNTTVADTIEVNDVVLVGTITTDAALTVANTLFA